MANTAQMQDSRIATNVVKHNSPQFFRLRRKVVTELFADFADNQWTADETNSFNRYHGFRTICK